MKVLILTASYGFGHLQTAKCLAQEFLNSGHMVHVLDLYKSSHPFINKISSQAYLKSYQYAPYIYSFLYYKSDDAKRYSKYISPVFSLGISLLRKEILNFGPDIVISTFPFLAYPILKQRGEFDIPCYFLVTDYYAHVQWIHPEIDGYFIGHESMRFLKSFEQVPEDKIFTTGIPVRKAFLTVNPQKEDRDDIHVLLCAGSFGVFPYTEKIVELFESQFLSNASLTIITGKNKRLYERIKHHRSKKITIKRYVENIEKDMLKADFMITKPGGLTVTEAMYTKTPMIFYNPTGGQESENARFLHRTKSSVRVYNEEDLITQIRTWMTNREVLKVYQENIGNLAKGDAASKIVKKMEQLHPSYSRTGYGSS